MSKKQYSSRFQKRKQNRTLNIAIGVVILLIVIVGANIAMNGGGSDQTSAPTKNEQAKEKKAASSSDSAKTDEKKNDDSIKVEEDNTSTETDDSSQADEQAKADKEKAEAEKKKAEEEAKKKEEEKKAEGGGPEGPWEPVGTSQSGEHTKSYDKGSPDWNEQNKALSYATGIPADKMTLLWLGNGGAPDKSVGRVLSQADGSKYEVQLQWIDGKGWQPTSVTKQ